MCRFLISSGASNLGSFIGGIGTLILGCAALYGVNTLKHWQKQKRFEKKIEWAESALIDFELYLEQINDWFRFMRHDVNEHNQKFFEIQKIFLKAKARTSWLRDEQLNSHFTDLKKLTGPAVGNFRKHEDSHFVQYITAEELTKAKKYLDETPQKINEIGEQISDKLKKIMLMEF